MFLIYYDKTGRRVRAPFWFYAMLALIGVAILLGYSLRFGLAWQAAQNWQPVEATIEALSVTDMDDRSSTGTAGLVALQVVRRAEIKAQFSYTFEGERYSSTRVFAFSEVRDTSAQIYEFYLDLNTARTDRSSVTAFVSPDRRDEAVLDRSLVWPQYWFLSGFGLFFILISALGVYDRHFTKD